MCCFHIFSIAYYDHIGVQYAHMNSSMHPSTIVFIGRSGCGKGTQANLIEEFLKKQDSDLSVVHLETGKLFREFVEGATYSQEKSKNLYKSGSLQPEFLTVHLWGDFLIRNMRKDSHLIIDGTPRRQDEASVLHTAFEFYERQKPHIFFINVSREWSETRMIERKRTDDTKQDIELRLNWFDKEVVPAIEYYKHNPFYNFHEINGERTIEEIHEDIVKIVTSG